MKIFVHAKPGAKKESVKEEPAGLFVDGRRAGERRFVVAVRERAVGGEANRAILRAVAEHLKISPARVRIVSGRTAKDKVIEIE
jgi:uncharacterized protein